MKENGEIFTSHYERSPFKNLNLLDLNSERELDMATKHIFDVFQITHRYQKDNNEVKRVIHGSIRNTATQTINISNFDEDSNRRLGKEEYNTYMQALDIAIRQVMSVGGYDAFKKITEDADAGVVYAFAKRLDMRKHVDAFFGEDLMGDLFEVDKSTLERWESEKFDITSSESWSNLCGVTIMTLGNDGIDMLRTLANMGSGAILAPRYLTYRAKLLNGTSAEKAEAEINISQLVSGNPSLGGLEIRGEKCWESVKTVAQNMFTGESTLGNIAGSLSIILSLLGGGAGILKLRKLMKNSPKIKKAKEIAREIKKDMKEPEMRTIRWSLGAMAITTPAAAIETTYNQAQRGKKDNHAYSVTPEMLTSLPPLHRNLVNKFLQEKSFSSAILEKFMGEIQRNPKLDIYEFFHQNGLNDKKRPFLERLKRTLYAYRDRHALVRDYFQRHKGHAKSIFEGIYGVKVKIPESAMKVEIQQASLIVSIDEKYRDYLSKNFRSLGFTNGEGGFNSHHLNHGFILFYETGDKKWREEAIAHEIQHSTDFLSGNTDYDRKTGLLNTEIVARIKQGRSKEQSKESLLTELYDYFKDIKTSSPTEYKKRRDDYTWAVEKYVDIAFEVKKKYPENANFLLSFTNMSDWEDLL